MPFGGNAGASDRGWCQRMPAQPPGQTGGRLLRCGCSRFSHQLRHVGYMHGLIDLERHRTRSYAVLRTFPQVTVPLHLQGDALPLDPPQCGRCGTTAAWQGREPVAPTRLDQSFLAPCAIPRRRLTSSVAGACTHSDPSAVTRQRESGRAAHALGQDRCPHRLSIHWATAISLVA